MNTDKKGLSPPARCSEIPKPSNRRQERTGCKKQQQQRRCASALFSGEPRNGWATAESAAFHRPRPEAVPIRTSARILKISKFCGFFDETPTTTSPRPPPPTLFTPINSSLSVRPAVKMGKDKSEKKDKREKKEKRSEKDGVHKSGKKDKKEKKDKTALAEAVEQELTTKVLEGIDQAVEDAPVEGVVKAEMDIDARPVGAVVPFASPLVEDKSAKKVLKSVKKAAVNKCLKRGVKEVVKALRKSPIPAPNAPVSIPNGVVILAADISPMDVISHIPVLCEDHGIPYVFVTSRAELGNSAATKRPTSVTMVVPKSASKGKKKDEDDDGEDFSSVYEELAKLAQKEAKRVGV
ncbi:hypothetical protein N8T08_002964 [Aspergillus melleus]|uniref:Uncharacterized protein n=1 Tax=Aspergillus melleus TaxID=138277 RepID=A0ACC3B855_9EURO|nr:hypothetical protein N8T08_002964 [Aspergillus melleus]